jgi:hypothetical protein
MPADQRLFSVTQFLLRIATLICSIILAVATLALTAVVVGWSVLLTTPATLTWLGIPLEVEGVPLRTILNASFFFVAGGLVGTIFLLLVARATSAIVDTAVAGDPFVSDNAERLKRIAWLLLGVMVVEFLSTSMIVWIAPDNNIAGHIDAGDGGPSLAGCLAVLLIFVLARIFRHGAEMRAELEGMV